MLSEVGGISPVSPSLLKKCNTPPVALYLELSKIHELDTFITPVTGK